MPGTSSLPASGVTGSSAAPLRRLAFLPVSASGTAIQIPHAFITRLYNTKLFGKWQG
jgi:hypothetical protein